MYVFFFFHFLCFVSEGQRKRDFENKLFHGTGVWREKTTKKRTGEKIFTNYTPL